MAQLKGGSRADGADIMVTGRGDDTMAGERALIGSSPQDRSIKTASTSKSLAQCVCNVPFAKRLLACTSVAALTLTAMPSAPFAETLTGSGTSSIASPVNFLILDNYHSNGQFTNKTNIGPATQFPILNDVEQIAFWIKTTSTFGGDILNLPGATITATHNAGANDLERHVIALRRDATVPVTNRGLISASATRDTLLSQATGVLLNGGGEFANSGTVRASVSGFDAGTAVGLESNVSTWQINNGSISADAGGGRSQNIATAVALNAGGTLVNNGNVMSTTSSGAAMKSTGVSIVGQGLLQNNGSILAIGNESTSAHAVMAKDSSVTSSGTISAQVIGGPEIKAFPLDDRFSFSVERTEVSAVGITASSVQNSGEVLAKGRANAGTGGQQASVYADVVASAKVLGASAESVANTGLIFGDALSNAFSFAGFPTTNHNATAVSETTAVESARVENAAQKSIWATAVAKALTWHHARATADAVGIAGEKDFFSRIASRRQPALVTSLQ